MYSTNYESAIIYTWTEYNPMLSDVTKTTRVAFVKFMAKGDKKRDEATVVNETKSALSRSSSKAVLNFRESIKRIIVRTIEFCY